MSDGGTAARADPAIPFMTPDLAGIGGVIKQRPEDFLVEEIPAYEPRGEGEHVYLLVQKRAMSTMELVGVVARHFGVARSAVGYAGLKDKHAVTRQLISVHVPGKTPDDFPALEHDRATVLWVDRHANKLRPGHLKGNRFSIRIRGAGFTSAIRARDIVARLEAIGAPNRFGPQRFGLLQNNHLVGLAVMREDYQLACDLLLGPCANAPGVNTPAREAYAARDFDRALALFPHAARAERRALLVLRRGEPPRRAIHAIDRDTLKYYMSAFQSHLFNATLDRRIIDGTVSTCLPGDLAFKHENGAIFAVTDDVASHTDTPGRLSRLEISPSGPMWAGDTPRARGEVGAIEGRILDVVGVTHRRLEEFSARYGTLIAGSRRPLRVPLCNTEVEGGSDEHGPYVRVAFDLPRGAFATSVLREIMKTGAGDGRSPARDNGEERRPPGSAMGISMGMGGGAGAGAGDGVIRADDENGHELQIEECDE